MYFINPGHPLFEELQSIFLKTIGLRDVLVEHLDSYRAQLALVFVHGAMAAGTFTSTSEVDLLVIGDISAHKLQPAIKKIEQLMNRRINSTVVSVDEVKDRFAALDPHFISLKNEKKLFIFGEKSQFENLAATPPSSRQADEKIQISEIKRWLRNNFPEYL
jgi:predicted nucleotidyltransferase